MAHLKFKSPACVPKNGLSDLSLYRKNPQSHIRFEFGLRPQSFPQTTQEWFLLAKEADGCTKSSIEWLREGLLDLERFCRFNGLPTDLCQLQREHILAWLISLRHRNDFHGRGKKLKSSTMNSRWRAVRLFFRWCHETGRIQADPTVGIKGPKPGKTLIPVFQEHHIQAMLQLCPPNTWWGCRDRAIILTLLLTGIRVGELANLTLSSVNLQDRYVTVLGKGNKERKVYLEKRLIKALIDWLEVRSRSIW